MKRYILDVNVGKLDKAGYTYIKRVQKEVIPTGNYYFVENTKYIEVMYEGWILVKKIFVPEDTVREVKKGIVV